MRPLKRFVPLDVKCHERKCFDCGKPQLNMFLCRNARRGMDSRASYTWVLPAADIPGGVLKPLCAFYTLSLCHVFGENLPADLAKRLPRYPLPAFLIAQLAVDLRCQGQGLGELVLVNALRRCASLSRKGQVPAVAVVLDVLDQDALRFYRRFEEFRPLAASSDSPGHRLFIPMSNVELL